MATSIGIWLYDTQTGQELDLFIGHVAPHAAKGLVAFSPDGKMLARGMEEAVILWDTTTGKIASILKNDCVKCLAFAPAGEMLAICGVRSAWLDGQRVATGVTLWNTATQETITCLEDHFVKTLSFSPDGKILEVESSDGAKFWDVDAKRAITTPDGFLTIRRNLAIEEVVLLIVAEEHGEYERDLSILASSFDKKILALGMEDDDDVILWDTIAKREIAVLGGHNRGSVALAFSPLRAILAVGMENGDGVILWSTARNREAAVLKGHGRGVFTLAS